jgi:hypothetical protein
MRRRDRVAGPALVDVAIEDPDDDAADDRGDDGDGIARGRRPRPLRPVYRWVLVGLGLVAVGVLVAAWVAGDAEDRREAADHGAALADVPGVLDSLDEPLRVLWSSQGVYPIAYTDDVVVVFGIDDGATLAMDAASGEVVWRRDGVRDEFCRALATGAERWRVPLPTDATYLDVGGSGTVLVHTVREVVAYR